MNDELKKSADASYQLADQKAAGYFKSLYMQVTERTYVPILTKNIHWWKRSHIQNKSFLSLFYRIKKAPDRQDYRGYIQWLNYTGKLDNYLNRSISYIFMRDLGKALDSPDTQMKIQRAIDNLKEHLTAYTSSKRKETDTVSMAVLYRRAQKEGIESTVIWLINKLKTVSAKIPKGMDAENAQRKLIKIIAGVMMHQIEEMDDRLSTEERTRKLDGAIRLGYSYGLTYPFIDDILDAKVLSAKETERYSNIIRTTLITGVVPELGEWTGENAELIKYIHSELKEAFEYIKIHQKPEKMKSFLEEAYVFFYSQEIDRVKDLSNANYTNEELYIPVILKSASSRLIARSVISATEDDGFDNRTFFYGIYNQLADDFADMFDDMEDGAVTPYTYYMKYHDTRLDLINPFELYWTVISNLIENVYNSDRKTCEVILDRAINGLKRFKTRMGIEKYREIMGRFAPGSQEFNTLIQGMVEKADDVDFFDKLLRDHMITILKNERKEQEEFLDTIKNVRSQINNILNVKKAENISLENEYIIDAANYSLKGDGKRLRPIVAWIMATKEYGLNESAILPLMKSLEYMHTASLIFDDLPSQDNAPTRRGYPTLHQVYDVATAELTGLFLTQKAIEEQTYLEQFDSDTVLELIRYSTKTTEKMCRGQAMDLGSKEKKLTLEQLNLMCFYKTGLAFEASLIMPAILGCAKESELDALKGFAYHAGIAFQIKDDLLDVEGDPIMLGKSIGRDTENRSSTYASILGEEGARKELWEHYCLAMEKLKDIPRNIIFLRHLLNYIVNRDH
ncbi:polyprenyl synthetase family protein [Clostridium chromiireducens]|uniref:Polyprenyl synthetase family protein n=2 Tax=Clostridium chromiireducens TaxID=225345 RepID=A0A964RP63_9CLOT|nr:polyprenyl synthetase family protein [Clostridium chromiireducens]